MMDGLDFLLMGGVAALLLSWGMARKAEESRARREESLRNLEDFE